MDNKTALIVDDSRTASTVLRRMLEKETFDVDVRESAEAALEYLDAHRPGVIFMDHMMPGLDGFQAVKAIKGRSETAEIPIVMYTSKSGELYIGQARALGAADILLKPPTRQSLLEVFERLDAREQAAASAAEPQRPRDLPVEPVETPDSDDDAAAARARPVVVPEPRTEVVVQRRLSPLGFLLALLIGIGAGYLVRDRIAPVDSEPLADLQWALRTDLTYAYGESPFGGERLDMLKELLPRLQAQGFEGAVRLTGHIGAFCLVDNGAGWELPPSNLPIENCGLIGHADSEAQRRSRLQSPAFRSFVSTSPLARQIRIEVEGRGDGTPRVEYPTPTQVRTAGDWNRIAARNNRVDVELIPAR
jgi:CheY-like chemotaxis protein